MGGQCVLRFILRTNVHGVSITWDSLEFGTPPNFVRLNEVTSLRGSQLETNLSARDLPVGLASDSSLNL